MTAESPVRRLARLAGLHPKIVQLQMANAKMRKALLLIAGGKDARDNYEEVAWHMAQLAAEALASEGGAE